MNRIRRWIRTWFGFSRTETNGFLILLPFMIILLFSEPVYRWWVSSRGENFTSDAQKLDSLIAMWDAERDSAYAENIDEISIANKPELNPFNPNFASVQELQKLGISKNLSTRIAHYRQKGGVFRVKGDLMKIYGMDSTLYAQLYAYILLPEHEEKKINVSQSIPADRNAIKTFDINTADTTQLKSINGIGSTLAKRIVRFREVLGGFIDPSQVGEVYGLDSAVVNKLNRLTYIDSNFVPKKINMNLADEKELSSHPYIKKAIAKAIVAYRFQHGNFKTVDDIRNITIVQASEAEKLIPYLKVSE
jgi:competence protein ComEA